MNNQNLINKIILEGELLRGSYSKTNKSIYFAKLKQERKVVNFKWIDYFSIYVLSPLSKKIAKILETDPSPHVIIEGELHNNVSKKTHELRSSILVKKIIDLSDNNKRENNNKDIIKE